MFLVSSMMILMGFEYSQQVFALRPAKPFQPSVHQYVMYEEI